MPEPTRHSTYSTLRERIVEHAFVGEALRALWRHGIHDVEVLRSEFDAFGYDLVMARKTMIRHIQFKVESKGETPSKVSVARALAEKPSGCVIWIAVDDDLKFKRYFYLGGKPGSPLPAIADFPNTRRTTRNKAGERPRRANHHDVPGRKFCKLCTLDEVLVALFGPLGEPAKGL